MPRYLLQIIEDEVAYTTPDPAEFDRIMAMHQDFSAAVTAAGAEVLGSEALRPTPTARYLRGTRTDEVHLVDNPAAELKEVLGGYYLIEAADEDQALEVAKLCPAPQGYIEVRPIWDFSAAS